MLKKWLFSVMLICFPLISYSATVLVVGDSLSAAYGIPIEKGWVALLQERLDHVEPLRHKVVNASTSGDTTQNGRDKLSGLLLKYNPAVTIIQLGGNDALRGLSLNVMQENLTAMVKRAKAQHSKVLLVGVPMLPNYGAAFIERFQQVYVEVAVDQQVQTVKNLLDKVGGYPKLMQADGIHPNEKAQQQLLDNIWPTLLLLMKAHQAKP